MEIRRFFADINCFDGEFVTISGSEFNHMTKVLRYKVGYKAIVCFNDGIEHLCDIVSIDKDKALLKVIESKTIDNKKCSISLFAGLLKNNKLDFAIQKCVELGIDEITPFTSSYSDETKFNSERANTICVESAKQCGSVYLTKVKELLSFDNMVEILKNFDTVIVAYEYEFKNKISSVKFNGKNVALIIGPEGGFKENEINALKSIGANVVTLGKRILRAETASIVLSTLTLDNLGELDYD